MGHPGFIFFDSGDLFRGEFLQGGRPLKHKQGYAHLAVSFESGPQISQSIGLRVLFLGDLSELAILELLDQSLGDRQILDHAVVFCLVLSLYLVDYHLGVAEDLDVFFPHLVGES